MNTSSHISPARPDSQAQQTCIECQKPIKDNLWFCRLPAPVNGAPHPEEAKILLCSPACALRFFDAIEF
jgi:hypothetical protein